jgi:DNA polymerase III epsilon subunit-like protein
VVAAIHGISQERAEAFGLPQNHVMGLFAGMVGMADLVVFHNADYDKVVLISEFFRRTEQPILDHKKLYCTMKGMTPICGLLKANNTPKWPKLQEAHKFCFGVEFEGAHDAMADVRACRDVFFWMVKNNYIQLENLING